MTRAGAGRILAWCSPGEVRVAALDGDALLDAAIWRPGAPDGVGDLHRGRVDAVKTEIRKLLKRRSVRFVTPGDRAFVRGGDGVLPLSQVKARFGEFALPSLGRGRPDGPAAGRVSRRSARTGGSA